MAIANVSLLNTFDEQRGILNQVIVAVNSIGTSGNGSVSSNVLTANAFSTNVATANTLTANLIYANVVTSNDITSNNASTINLTFSGGTANSLILGGINVSTALTAAFAQANTDLLIANLAFDKANTAQVTAVAAFAQANTVSATTVTAAFDQANTSQNTAVAAFAQANTDLLIANLAFNQANSAANLTINTQNTNYTITAADANKIVMHGTGDATIRTYTIPANSTVAFVPGTTLTFINHSNAANVVIAITTDTMRLAPMGNTGSRNLTANGIATAIKTTWTEWMINGSGIY